MEKSKLLSRRTLARLLARRGKKKVVFTNGCFDLLHPGHVRLLRAARSRGDILVVGLNSDRSVRRLKGPGRPLMGERSRAEVLSALSAVDYVTLFSEPTPLETIAALKPDVLVKGSDYPPGEIVGRHLVGKVVRFPVAGGFSTTDLIGRILRSKSRKARR
ncbi:MAG: glycerol-3-phosphate cytidylyltransferase [Elusimicrobia bacterium RIFCSPHIGHO2_01_FULL_64_10]|nr:MAG: glycerol-3-phosphate cytidylyltransferase [Elusimicrobia bacterium RIFCSPHIGHO2_01_FULL_64_10]